MFLFIIIVYKDFRRKLRISLSWPCCLLNQREGTEVILFTSLHLRKQIHTSILWIREFEGSRSNFGRIFLFNSQNQGFFVVLFAKGKVKSQSTQIFHRCWRKETQHFRPTITNKPKFRHSETTLLVILGISLPFIFKVLTGSQIFALVLLTWSMSVVFHQEVELYCVQCESNRWYTPFRVLPFVCPFLFMPMTLVHHISRSARSGH